VLRGRDFGDPGLYAFSLAQERHGDEPGIDQPPYGRRSQGAGQR
jgi:hypothetical protein